VSFGGPRPSLEEARERLRNLGYLQGRVERFVFRRALESVSGFVAPLVAGGAVALAVAETAAVASSQFRFGDSARAVALLFVELATIAVLPALLFAIFVSAAGSRSRRPGRTGTALALFAAGGTLVLWLAATWRLGPRGPATVLLWAVPVSIAAILLGAITRAAVLARAYARSGRLPERPRRAILGFAAAGALAVAAVLLATRKESPRPAPPLPSPRTEPVVVLAIDGLALDGPAAPETSALAALLRGGATGWWPASLASPAEIWTDIATGVPAGRHGIRALEWVRPWGLPALRPPLGTEWWFRGLGLAVGAVTRAPVSAWERRSPVFWEVAASAGLPSLAVGWWASGPWSGADVVENREVLGRASNGAQADAVATAEFERRRSGRILSTLYLPGPDIERDDPVGRRSTVERLTPEIERQISRARNREIALVVVAADSHPREGWRGRMFVFDGNVPTGEIPIRSFDVAPSVLARAGVPAARDPAGRPTPVLFAPRSLETATVGTYGDRVLPEPASAPASDREYLEKLRSLGYLQ
jgi:hypothetical protein